MNRILCKFGGSSLASSTQLKQVKDIILSDPSRKIVVCSAPGKDERHDVKVTDLLMLLHAHVSYGIAYDGILSQLYDRYHHMIEDLSIDLDFDAYFAHFKASLHKGMIKDEIIANGEYFMGRILAAYLGYRFVDAGDVIHLNHDGTIHEEKTKQALHDAIKPNDHVVIPGFYATTPECKIRVFNRGGSDLTGSIVCKALDIYYYENWTDVSGLCTSDPTIIKDPLSIEEITYQELRELSYRGAQVIQQESLVPLEASNITLHIKNTFDPTAKGTKISASIKGKTHLITGLTGSKDHASLTITKSSDVAFSTMLKDVIDVMSKHKITIEHIPTGIDTFSLIVSSHQMKDVYFHLREDLSRLHGLRDVSFEENVALIAVVSRNMGHIPGVAGKIFKTLGDEHINIKVIAQASNELSIIIGVDNKDYENSLNVLYQSFYMN